MSGISTLTANVQAFRMNMPKTPDRGSATPLTTTQKTSSEDENSNEQKTNLDMSGISNLKAAAY